MVEHLNEIVEMFILLLLCVYIRLIHQLNTAA